VSEQPTREIPRVPGADEFAVAQAVAQEAHRAFVEERAKLRGVSPGERYARDPHYSQLVQLLADMMDDGSYTPGEIAAAATLAITRHEERAARRRRDYGPSPLAEAYPAFKRGEAMKAVAEQYLAAMVPGREPARPCTKCGSYSCYLAECRKDNPVLYGAKPECDEPVVREGGK
jgi:hypothetical protein